MSNPNNMLNDPYAVELELTSMLEQRYLWLNGRKYNNLNPDKFEKQMKLEYKYLNEASPMIFKNVLNGFLDDKYNLNMMKKMIGLSKDIYDGKKKQNEVDKGLGSILANKFVKPIIDKLDNEK